MITIQRLLIITLACASLTACRPTTGDTAPTGARNTSNANTTANANTAKPAAAAPTKEALLAIEKQGWDAWKARDATSMGALLSDRYMGFGPAGRVDKAGSLKTLEQKCEIKSYSFSDEQMHPIGNDVAVLSFRAAQDYTCDGKKGPADVWSSAIYAREGDTWKAVYYSETPALDPKAPTPKAATAITAQPDAKYDDLTTALMAVEKAAWDAWKNRDVKGVEAVMAKDFWTVSDSGRRDKAAAIKAWSEPKCEGIEYTFGEPKATSLTKDVALVTYKADVKGSCDGRTLPPTVWVASLSIKEGETWKNAFYTDMNRW